MTPAPAVPRVLVAEADDSIAAALQFIVTREGMQCDRIDCGSEAMDRIRESHPDIVLLDVMLPDISGYEICLDVRNDPSLGAVKIVMMNSRGSTKERKKALTFGADGFVTKPFDLVYLRRELQRLAALLPH